MLSGYVTFYEGHHEGMAKKEIEMCIFGEEPLIKKLEERVAMHYK